MINRLCGSAGLYHQPAHTLRWRGDCSACCRPPWSWPPMRSGLGSPDAWSSSSLCAPCARWSCTLHCLRPPSLRFTLFRLLRHDVLSLLSDKIDWGLLCLGGFRKGQGCERGKKVRERERWKRLREPATFSTSIWKKKSEQRDHWSGATAQRLSSLRTDWLKSRIGPLSGRHHIGTLFSASRRLQKRAARARRLPFATLPPRRPSTPSSLIIRSLFSLLHPSVPVCLSLST